MRPPLPKRPHLPHETRSIFQGRQIQRLNQQRKNLLAVITNIEQRIKASKNIDERKSLGCAKLEIKRN